LLLGISILMLVRSFPLSLHDFNLSSVFLFCFSPAAIPYGEFEGNPHTLLITTSCGGHFGYLEGVWPTKETWMNRLNRQLLAALKQL
jgi:hypothetical protein